MSKLYFHSEYTKDIKHILNYLVYAGEKLEAQEVILSTGEIVTINADEVIDFTKYPDVQSVQIHTKSGRDVSFTPNEYNMLIKQDKEIEHMTPKGYIDYIAERPGAVKDEIGGLFTINGSISTEKALEIAEQYPNNTWWINIISLKREDAERVGFDNRENFEDLIRSKIPDICKNYNISMENLIIYGAYHDKINNPHVHLFFTSKDNREGFVRDLTKSSYNMKRDYFNTIYKEDMKILYEEKDEHKKELNKSLENSIKRLSAKSYVTEKQVLQSFVDLSNALKTEKGKLQYGYLTKDNKRLVDTLLIDIINRDKEVNKCFKECLNTQEKFLRNYTSDEETIKDKLDDYKVRILMPYSKQKDNILQNIIVKNIANYNKKSFNIPNNNDIDYTTFSYLSENDPKFMYQLGKKYLYEENNPLEAEDMFFKSYLLSPNRYTAFELGNTWLKLDNIENARNYFNEYESMLNEKNIKHPYEFYTVSKFYEFYKKDFKDLSQYKDNTVLENLTDELISKKEQEYSLKEYLNLKVSANMGYIPAIQKIKNISPIQLTNNINFDYSIHNNNPYIMTELNEMVKSSNIDSKDVIKYELSQNIISNTTYNNLTEKEKVKFNFNEKIILAKAHLDLANTPREVYLSKNLFTTNYDYISFFNEHYDKFLDIVKDISKTKDKEDEKLDFAIYLLKQDEQEPAKYILKDILNEEIKTSTIINISKEDTEIKRELLSSLSSTNDKAGYFLGKDYFYSNISQEKQKGIKILSDLSDKGNQYASIILGRYYLNDISSQNTQKAIELLENAIKLGNNQGRIILSQYYLGLRNDEYIQKAIELLQPLIDKKDIQATFILGRYFINSKSEDEKLKGLKLLEINTEHNPSKVQIGKYYLSTENENNIQKGINILESIINDKNGVSSASAMYVLGKYYFYNQDETKQKGIDLIKQASDKGHTYSKLFLIDQKMKSNILSKDDIDFLKSLSLKRLNQNNIERNSQATFLLAKHFLQNKRELMAVPLLNYSANKGNDFALIMLSEYYLKKDDTNLKEKAIHNLNKLIEKNNINAMYSLGKFYLYSEDKQLKPKSVDLLEKAIAKGHTYAKFHLTKYYINNNIQTGYKYLNDLKQLDDEYLRTSANRISSRIELDRGNLKSAEKDLLNVYYSKYVTNMDIYNLGHIYDKIGNEKSANIYYTQALEGFKKESTPTNNYMLGIMYLTGRGCEKDTIKAKEYFKLADKQGHPNSKEMIASINKQTIYACNHLLQAIAYNLMTVANQNYDYNKNLNKHKSKNNFRKPKIYRISKIQENIIQKTKSQENNHDYSIGY